MPDFTPEQRQEFLGHIMSSGKFSKDEAFMMLHEAEVAQGGGGPQMTMDKPLAQQMGDFLEPASMIAGAVTGGIAAPALAEKYLPQAAMKYIPRAVASGAGQAAGQFVGSIPAMVRGKISPAEAAKQSATTGVIGGSFEAAMNLLTRGLASLGGVQQRAVTQAYKSPTGAGTVLVNPGDQAEATLGNKIVEASGPQQNLTPGRMSTVDTINKMQAAGQRVDITPTLTQLDEHIATLERGGIGTDARAALRKLRALRSDISDKYLGQSASGAPPRIAVTPAEADSINQQLQDSIGNAFGRPGGKEATRMLKGVSAAHTEAFRTQTGTAESAAATKARLDAIEAVRGQISDKSPESFVRSVGDAIMTKGESGDQTALMALRAFDKTGDLEKQIAQLASQREWTGSQSRIAHNVKFEFLRRLPRALAKVTLMATKPVGSAAAATSAFQQAMQPMNNP